MREYQRKKKEKESWLQISSGLTLMSLTLREDVRFSLVILRLENSLVLILGLSSRSFPFYISPFLPLLDLWFFLSFFRSFFSFVLFFILTRFEDRNHMNEEYSSMWDHKLNMKKNHISFYFLCREFSLRR